MDKIILLTLFISAALPVNQDSMTVSGNVKG
jgi:hypothetical protein